MVKEKSKAVDEYKMNKVIKKLWIKALRSGEYDQGRSRLVTVDDNQNHDFCCLGVLQNLYCLENNLTFNEKEFSYCNHTTAVAIWSGLAIGVISGELCYKNDNGYSLKRMADYIDKNL